MNDDFLERFSVGDSLPLTRPIKFKCCICGKEAESDLPDLGMLLKGQRAKLIGEKCDKCKSN